MAFEDFYKKEDERARRWRKSMIAAAFLCVGYVVSAFVIAPESEVVDREAVVEPSAAKSADEAALKWINLPRRRRVEEICGNLPKPEKFKFAKKEILVENDDLTVIAYFYESKRTRDEILPGFVVWLSANGWKPLYDAQTIFAKHNQTISFQENSTGAANYIILCSEKDDGQNDAISFGVDDL